MPTAWDEFEVAAPPANAPDWSEFEVASPPAPKAAPKPAPLPPEFTEDRTPEGPDLLPEAHQASQGGQPPSLPRPPDWFQKLPADQQGAYVKDLLPENPAVTFARMGRGARGALADIGSDTLRDVTQGKFPNAAAGWHLKPLPIDTTMEQAGAGISFPYKVAGGAIETAPKLAAVMASGPASPITAAALFGYDEQGNFHPASAAIAAALPMASRFGGNMAEVVAEKLGVSGDAALDVVQAGGRYLTANAIVAAQQLPRWSKMTDEQKQAAAANVLVMGLLGLADFAGLRTGRERAQYATQAAERGARGLTPFPQLTFPKPAAAAPAAPGDIIDVEATLVPQQQAEPAPTAAPAAPQATPVPPVQPTAQPAAQPAPAAGLRTSAEHDVATAKAMLEREGKVGIALLQRTHNMPYAKAKAAVDALAAQGLIEKKDPNGPWTKKEVTPDEEKTEEEKGVLVPPAETPGTQTTTGTAGTPGTYLQQLGEHVKAGTLTKAIALDIMAAHHGKSMGEGGFTAKDMTDAVEVAVNQVIAADPQLHKLDVPSDEAAGTVTRLKALVDKLPTQTTRSEEQVKLQQFSTPPHLAYVANWVAALRPGDVVLEPSAGVGGLAVFPKANGLTVIGNEFSPRRADLLEQSGLASQVTRHNAEQINALLHAQIQKGEVPPITAVVMNPPFSRGAESGQKGTIVGAKHVEEALKLLPPGGRLVAIVGEGMGMTKPKFKPWWNRIQKTYNVRANIGMSGEEYKKYGTTFGNQLLVIDKTAPTDVPLTGTVPSVGDLVEQLTRVRHDRKRIEPTPAQRGGAATAGKGTAAQTPAANAPAEPGARGPGGRTGPVQPGEQGAGGLGVQPTDAGERTRPPASGGVSPGVVHPPAAEAGGSGGKHPPGGLAGISVQKLEAGERELTEHGVFSEYTPQKVQIAGAKQHPTPLVEPTAMASVAPVDPSYTPQLPKKLIEDGALSDAQLENVVYAGQAHGKLLPNGQRMGYFIGDGTGVGKGRQIAAVIVDNWNQGRRKAVWVTKSKGLIRDAGRDLGDLGMDPKHLIDLAKNKGKALESAGDGIAFVPYSSLRGGNPTLKASDKPGGQPTLVPAAPGKETRMHLLNKWLGKDFDGVIVFDEAHQAGNAVAVRGPRGMKEPSAQGLTVVDMQKLFPQARVLYASATGATDVTNLSYADRLGIWGPGTPFADKAAFFDQIQTGGLSAMEIVARDLKSMGRYMARTLSFEGVGRRQLVHKLTDDQTQIYDQLAQAWQYVLTQRDETMARTGAANSGAARSAANSAFFGAQQRFYNQLLTAMQMPSVLTDAGEQLKSGNSVVFQIVNTNEATLGREVAAKSGGDEESEDKGSYLEDLDLSPRDILVQYIEASYPTALYKPVADAEGNVRWVEVKDEKGNPVSDPQALEKKQELIDRVRLLKAPSNPLEMLLDQFGEENVAEVTGRSSRVVMKKQPDGTRKRVLEQGRGENRRKVEAQEFQDLKRRILVFSDAGGTGFSYHASRKAKNQQRRIHYLIQAGWRADTAMQGFGRTHRSDQANAPEYALVSTNIKGHQRFISTIARRLAELGALTGGERKSAGGELFTDENNLENDYAEDAVTRLFTDLYRGAIEGLNFGDVTKKMGFTKTILNPNTGEMTTINNLIDAKTGGLNPAKIPTIQQFLNRVLALEVGEQNHVFDEFSTRMSNRIAAAKEDGSYDPGTQTLKALAVRKLSDQVVYQHPDSTAQTRLVEVEHDQPVKITHWKNIATTGQHGAAEKFVQSTKNQRVFALKQGPNRTTKSGSVVETWRRISVTGAEIIPKGEIRTEQIYSEPANYKELAPANAQALWEEQAAKAPKQKTYQDTYLTGAFLPIWDRIQLPDPKIWRVTTGPTGPKETFLGAHIPPGMIADLRRRLGAGSGAARTPKAVFSQVLDRGTAVELANGWTLKRSRVAGENRIEVTGVQYGQMKEFTEFLGGYLERIQHQPRFFVPTDEAQGVAVLEKMLKKAPPIEQKQTLGDKLSDALDWLKTDDPTVGSFKAIPVLINAAVDAAKFVLRNGGKTVDAIRAAVNHVRSRLGDAWEQSRFINAMRHAFDRAQNVEPPLPTMEEQISGEPLAPREERPEPPQREPELGLSLQSLADWTRGTVGGMAGKTFPRTTLVNQRLGELMARWVSSAIAAQPMAELFAADVIGASGINPVHLGAALTEDNLRSVKQAFEDAGDVEHADAVNSFIGERGFPFATETEYQDFLNDPAVRQVLRRHKALWAQVVEPQYRQAMSLDPNMELPSRGLQTGARINLYAVREGEESRGRVRTTKAGSLTGTFRRKSPFGIQARGTGEAYHTDYRDIMENTFGRQMETANKNAFEDALVAQGHGAMAKPGQTVMIEGRPAKSYPSRRRSAVIVKMGEPPRVKSQNQDLYVNAKLASEYEAAANVNKFPDAKLVRGFNSIFNKLAISGLTDVTVHLTNLASALATLPGTAGGNLLTDTVLSVLPGRPDVTIQIFKALAKGFKDNRAQIASLAQIGALRGGRYQVRAHEPLTWLHTGGDVIRFVDRATRMALDDTYKYLVAAGLAEDSETARREFVNQVGQYNARAQGWMKRFFRHSGLGPFVTAGTTGNVLGVRGMLLNPGVKAKSAGARAILSANMLAKIIGTLATIALLNWLFTRKKGGGMLGRPGVPFGAIDMGMDDRNGRPQYLNLLGMVGPFRGARVTGVKGFVQAKIYGLPTGVAVDQAARDILNAQLSPWTGPVIRAGFIAASGSQPAIGVPRSAPIVPPGANQLKANVKEALLEASPVVKGLRDATQPGNDWKTALEGQLPRFTLQPGKPPGMMRDYPAIVRRAQANAFIEDVIGRARKLEPGVRMQFLHEQVDRLENPQDKAHAVREFHRRKVI